MKLLSVIRARSIWLFDIQDLNPHGKDVEADITDWLKDSYHFSKFPADDAAISSETGLVFEDGSFQLRDEYFIAVNLTVYSDGLVAETRSTTKDTDAFLTDLLESASKEFALAYSPEMIRKKLYISELNVRFEKPIHTLTPKFDQFSKRIATFVEDGNSQFETIGITFGTEVTAGGRGPLFQLERRVGAPFSELRYYTQAPMHTDSHLQLLGEFEQLL